ncbi:MAG: hypothetical protein ACWA5R_13980 [bacterium]
MNVILKLLVAIVFCGFMVSSQVSAESHLIYDENEVLLCSCEQRCLDHESTKECTWVNKRYRSLMSDGSIDEKIIQLYPDFKDFEDLQVELVDLYSYGCVSLFGESDGVHLRVDVGFKRKSPNITGFRLSLMKNSVNLYIREKDQNTYQSAVDKCAYVLLQGSKNL